MIEGFLARHAPRMPQRDSVLTWMSPLAVSATIHAVTIVALLAVALAGATPPVVPAADPHESARLPAARIVFLPSRGPGGGGGGGGNRQPPPTNDALRNKIQGTVILEVIVRRDGIPSDIRVVRSLDRRRFDEQAIAAVQQRRFYGF